MTELDETDRAILRALSGDATLSAGEIGRRLGLSQRGSTSMRKSWVSA